MRIAATVFCLLTAMASPAFPQILLDSTEKLAWDRPEAWAMKYFTAVSMMGGYAGSGLAKGTISIGLEAAWVPRLTEDERRVGFIGSKVEDLNRTSGFGRVRAGFGLPAGWDLTLGYVPQVEIGGVTPEVFNLALSRAVLTKPRWTLSARGVVQAGTLTGDLTCPAGIVGSSDPVVNPDNCLEPSSDEVTMDYFGIEWTYSRTGSDRWRPYVSTSAYYLDLEFQVRARYSLFIDRGRLLADGWIYSLAAGIRFQTSGPISLAGEIFYAPLDVAREVGRSSQNDPLVNARVLIEYRIRQ